MPTDGDHQVIQFRPRTALRAGGWDRAAGSAAASRKLTPAAEPDHLKHYETRPEEPDEYRHRMIANLAAGVFAIALTAIGIWLAITISDLRKTQDCVLYGRRDCGGVIQLR